MRSDLEFHFTVTFGAILGLNPDHPVTNGGGYKSTKLRSLGKNRQFFTSYTS